MNKHKLISLTLGLLIMVIISGCANTAGTVSSWPGVEVEDKSGFFAYGSQIFAIDTRNGTLLWQYPQEPSANVQFYAAPAVTDDLVIAGSYANTLVAVNKSNGMEKWKFNQAGDRYIGSPLVYEDMIFAPNSDGILYALNADGDLLWKFKAAGPNWTKPLADGVNVYLASMDHYVYGLKMRHSVDELTLDENGGRTMVPDPLWKTDVGAAIVANPVLKDSNIFVATIEGHLYCIDANSGRLKWTFKNGDGYRSVWGSLVATDEALFFGDEAGNVYAISTISGEPLWPTPYSAGASVIPGGVLTDEGPLFVNHEGRAFIINVDKEPRPVVSLNTVIYSPPKITDSRVILAPATREKLFMAIDLNGNEIWSFAPSE